MEWTELARMTQDATLAHLGESGVLDGVPVRFVTINPDETYDIGETEYHGQTRRFGLLDATAPAYAVGSLIELRSQLFEVTGITSDGEGMHELIVRERDPNALDSSTLLRLRSIAVVDAPTITEPAATATLQEWFEWLDAHGIADAEQPANQVPYVRLRWLDRHLLRGGA